MVFWASFGILKNLTIFQFFTFDTSRKSSKAAQGKERERGWNHGQQSAAYSQLHAPSCSQTFPSGHSPLTASNSCTAVFFFCSAVEDCQTSCLWPGGGGGGLILPSVIASHCTACLAASLLYCKSCVAPTRMDGASYDPVRLVILDGIERERREFSVQLHKFSFVYL